MPNTRKAIEGDGHTARRRATEDDVEGHRLNAKAVEGEGINRRQATEDDVEGHRLNAKAVEGEGINRRQATEDDVEGHRLNAKAVEGEGINRRQATEDDDVEGHNIGALNPIMARDLARAHERDIQREVSRNSLIADAKRAQRKR
jgi:hypothetical protein